MTEEQRAEYDASIAAMKANHAAALAALEQRFGPYVPPRKTTEPRRARPATRRRATTQAVLTPARRPPLPLDEQLVRHYEKTYLN
jgi:hypothetical protein